MRCWGLRKNERIMENERRTFDAFRGRVKSKQIVIERMHNVPAIYQKAETSRVIDDVADTNLEQL